MKAISLWQPWASAIALRIKHNETRSWETQYRGTIAIHAAKKSNRELEEHFRQLCVRESFYRPFLDANLHSFFLLPKGAIVAVAHLEKIVSTTVMAEFSDELELDLGDYSAGRFAWHLTNIQPLKQPCFITGRQGLFDVPDGILKSI